ncbi:MAG: ABC transporter ATP-binding protein [Patulibacter sp.]
MAGAPLPENSDALGVSAVGVSKAFGARQVLTDVTLKVPPATVCAVEGRNGAGKTTLMRALSSIVIPDTGKITINGFDTQRAPLRARASVGLALVNERSLEWRLTATSNLQLWAAIRGIARRDMRRVIDEALASVGLTDQGNQSVFALSSGQRHRLVLARAMLGDPPVLLIDEPLRGLDAPSIELVLAALQQRQQAGACVIVAAPQLDELATIAQMRLGIDDTGRLAKTDLSTTEPASA